MSSYSPNRANDEEASPPIRRRRGVLLRPQAFEKLLQAKLDIEFRERKGDRLTLEDMSDRTGLSVETVMKVFSASAAVDRQTLAICFKAFGLVLEPNDYVNALGQSVEPSAQATPDPTPSGVLAELPEGQVPLKSSFYIERPPCEEQAYRAIRQAGALVRLRAARRMGKTSLLVRILQDAEHHTIRAVRLSFRLADKAVLQNLDRFLQWFCASVGLGLKLPNRLETLWDPFFGSKVNCKIYFEEYLLTQLQSPIVLGLDDVDLLFQYPEVAEDFFGLLRAWHEESKNSEIWKKLRLVVAYSTEIYIPLNINQSPFNVGILIDLPEFTESQSKMLAQRYQLSYSATEIGQLMALVGGHPYLVRKAFYHLWAKDLSLEELLKTAATPQGIYREYFQSLTWSLEQNRVLKEAFEQVMQSESPTELELVQALKLQGLGLVHVSNGQAVCRSRLHYQYFKGNLGEVP
ncbi:MAG: AAA-like domain-containing protein [Thermosynechococcaceae cyanobacterium MS004]|nr:AAA-like domain-containing protein [Thermosynechococcaceae cyanobacterium MS004]